MPQTFTADAPRISKPRASRELAIYGVWLLCALVSVISVFFILLFLVGDGLPAFQEIGLVPFLTGATWSPTFVIPAYGILPLIVGTLLVTLTAMVFAVPLSIASAIYLSELAPYRVKAAIKPAIELLAGIPSVVFGFFGLIVLVEWIRVTFAVPSGESVLAGGILLGVMSLPTIISVTEDALSAVPREFREGSLALGATRWQTISRVVLAPAAPGIITGAILSIGRAAGETAPILFTAVVFSQRNLPGSVFDPVMALPYHLFILATNVPGAETNKYGTAVVLILLVCAFYAVAIYIRNRYHTTLRL